MNNSLSSSLAASPALPPALVLRGVQHTFKGTEAPLTVLKDVHLTLYPGQITALVGPSGSGKSTLLHISGLLEKPSEGEVIVAGTSCHTLSEKERSILRRHTLGFVYQFHHLLPEFSALENIMLPQLIKGVPPKEAKIRGLELLERVGLTSRATHRPARLSGGEQQRVAIVRALANNPQILLADEPTGNLDPETAEVVFEELIHLVKTQNMAALIATHNPDLARRMDRTLRLHQGHLEEM